MSVIPDRGNNDPNVNAETSAGAVSSDGKDQAVIGGVSEDASEPTKQAESDELSPSDAGNARWADPQLEKGAKEKKENQQAESPELSEAEIVLDQTNETATSQQPNDSSTSLYAPANDSTGATDEAIDISETENLPQQGVVDEAAETSAHETTTNAESSEVSSLEQAIGVTPEESNPEPVARKKPAASNSYSQNEETSNLQQPLISTDSTGSGGGGASGFTGGHHDKFLQPLSPMASDQNPFEVVHFEEFNEKISSLAGGRILLVTCDFQDPLNYLPYMIADAEYEFGDYEKFLIKTEIAVDENQSNGRRTVRKVDYQEVVQSLKSRGNRGNSLCFLPVASREMLESLYQTLLDPHFFHDNQALMKMGYRTVCLIDPDTYRNHPPPKDIFDFWKIDFLLPLLILNKIENANEVEIKLRALQKRLGGESKEYYERVLGLLNKLETLDQEISRLESPDPSLSTIRAINFDHLDEVQLCAIFTSAFFPGLTRSAFDLVMRTLLSGKKVRVSVRSPEISRTVSPTPTASEQKHGTPVLRTRGVPQALPLREYVEEDAESSWRKRRDKVLEQCHLAVSSKGIGQELISFESVEQRKYVVSLLTRTKGFYVDDQFECLFSSGLLFATETPRSVVKKLIEMAGIMSSRDSERYGPDWLSGIVSAIVHSHQSSLRKIETLQIFDVESGNPRLPNVLDALIGFQQLIDAEGKKQFLIERLGDLCAELASSSHTKETVEVFLESLLNPKTAQIVLQLVCRLRWVRDFNYFQWLPRFFMTSNPSICAEARDLLVDETVQDSSKFDHVARALRNQFQVISNQESTTAKFSIAFIYDFYRESRRAMAHSLARGEEVEHPVFPARIAKDTDLRKDRRELLLEWLTHPKLGRAVLQTAKMTENIDRRIRWGIPPKWKDLSDSRKLRFLIIADIVEGWQEMAEVCNDEHIKLACQELVQHLRASDEKVLRPELHKIFIDKSELYLRLISERPPTERSWLREARSRARHLQKSMRKSTRKQ